MRRTLGGFSAALAVVALSAQLQAGGFWLTLGNPDASGEARAMHAVATVKAFGCHNPADATITGIAIGVLDGKRQTIPLKLTRLREPGMYAVARQWPSEGRWVVQFTGRYNGAVASTLAPAGPNGVDRFQKKELRGEPGESDIRAMLEQAVTLAKK